VTLQDVAADSIKAMASYAEFPDMHGDFPIVQFTLTGDYGTGRRRLMGRRGPVGKCLYETQAGVVVNFNALEVLEFCAKVGKQAVEAGQ
jgi:hypothetical protein